MRRTPGSHIDEGRLLRFADGELPAREEKEVRRHLASCWQCRTELDELEKTIGECVRYRNRVLRDGLPEPPAPWGDIYREFARAEEDLNREPWVARFWTAVRRGAVASRPMSVAALIVIALVVVEQLRNTPSVQAAELLKKATVAAEAREGAPRWIEIREGDRALKREVAGGHGVRRVSLSVAERKAMETLRSRFDRARYSWDDPLSAASFAAWRETLAEKRDEVSTIMSPGRPGGKRYRIRTQTDSSELIDATIELTADRLAPVESRLRFRGDHRVEILALPGAPAERIAPPAAVASGAPPRTPIVRAPAKRAESVRPATAGEELEVLALLHRLGADLGEPVDVERAGGKVVVSGIGVSAELGQRIESELRDRPNVVVRFSDPQPLPAGGKPAPAEEVVPARPTATLRAELEQQLGGRSSYDEFSDRILELSDALMARVHALRRLAERIDPEAEKQLSRSERETLVGLRRQYAGTIAGLSARIEGELHPLLRAAGAAEPAPNPVRLRGANWQEATADLFQNARVAESYLAVILGGAATSVPPAELPSRALDALEHLRVRSAEYARLP